MGIAQYTDERLRHWLNSDQPSRERLCIAILALDRSFSDIKPRRPNGGPDGSRDIECYRGPDLCYGAVGFLNDVSDSPKDKRDIKKKFSDDLNAALEENKKLKAFVFFTNVDLTPGEIDKLKQWAISKGVSFVEIYWRERIRLVLDTPDGFAFRYQFLSIKLSDAEQSSFFSRFGKDLEELVTGGFNRLEKKIDFTEFKRWQTGAIRKINLQILFKELEPSLRKGPEHFRVCLEMQSVYHEKRSIFIGGQDDYYRSDKGEWYFGSKTFFFKQRNGNVKESWIPQGVRAFGGHVDSINFGVRWLPISDILAAEFEGLSFHFHFTDNLTDRIAKVKFSIDSYIFIDREIRFGSIDYVRPSIDWPAQLTKEQEEIKWRYCDFGWVPFDRLPKIGE